MLTGDRKYVVIFFAFWILYFLLFWSQAIKFDQLGHVMVGSVNIWGDWAAHFTIGSHLAEQQLLPTASPFLINHVFSYPFLADAISAFLIRLGTPFFQAFVIPSYIFSVALVAALYYFYQQLFSSKKLAIAAALVFLLNGGLGFAYYFQDIANSTQPWHTALNPPRKYTNIEPLHIRWISVIDSMVIPQRAFTLGFPLALVILTLAFQQIEEKKVGSKKFFLTALLLGILPLAHTHSFLAVIIILTSWGIADLITSQDKNKAARFWIGLGGSSAILATPVILSYFWNTVSESGFIKWFPGWYAFEFAELGWLEFWVKNWGVVPLLSILGLILYLTPQGKFNKFRIGLFAPFFIIFILLNLFLFQPFIWDNTKLLVWAAVGMAGLAAYSLRYLWHWWKPAAVVLFFISIFAGSLDAYHVVRTDLNAFQMYTAGDLELASWVKENTPTNSIWLTGDQHNHWLYNLTGRQSLLTFRGWLWTHGYNYAAIEDDVLTMYSTPLQNQALFEKYGVDYVIIGPNEFNNWQANQDAFQKFPIVKENEYYRIYAISTN